MAAADGKGRVRLLLLQQYVLSLDEIGAELEETGRVDALLVDTWCGALGGDGEIEGFLDRLGVGGEMSGGEVESAGDLVVAGHPTVGGEQALDIEAWQGEEISQGVLELHPGQPAELDAGRAGFGGELRQRGVEVLQEG